MSRLKDKIQCIGLWNSFNKINLIETVKKMDSLDEMEIEKDKHWGHSWKRIFNIYN
jgi:hypothetical protein